MEQVAHSDKLWQLYYNISNGCCGAYYVLHKCTRLVAYVVDIALNQHQPETLYRSAVSHSVEHYKTVTVQCSLHIDGSCSDASNQLLSQPLRQTASIDPNLYNHLAPYGADMVQMHLHDTCVCCRCCRLGK